MENYFNELNSINVNENTDKKGKFTYLSWSFAWGELKKKYPEATYNVHKFEGNKPYLFDEDLGYMIFTDVTVNGITHEMWLPVMDGANKSMKNEEYTYDTKYKKGNIVEKASMIDINKAIMRCLVKNIGMHGIGLYIYAGEDLPEEVDVNGKETKKDKTKTEQPKQDDVKDIQTKITNLFEQLVSEHGTREKLYEAINMTDVRFKKGYTEEPAKLWEYLIQYAN